MRAAATPGTNRSVAETAPDGCVPTSGTISADVGRAETPNGRLSRPLAWCAVPHPDRTRLVLGAQHAQRRRVEHQQPPVDRWQPEPAGGQHPQEVAMGEDRHVTVDALDPVDHPVGTRRDLLDGLAARHRSAEDRPAGHVDADLRRRPPLVVAVVPLPEVLVDGDLRSPRAPRSRSPGGADSTTRSRTAIGRGRARATLPALDLAPRAGCRCDPCAGRTHSTPWRRAGPARPHARPMRGHACDSSDDSAGRRSGTLRRRRDRVGDGLVGPRLASTTRLLPSRPRGRHRTCPMGRPRWLIRIRRPHRAPGGRRRARRAGDPGAAGLGTW